MVVNFSVWSSIDDYGWNTTLLERGFSVQSSSPFHDFWVTSLEQLSALMAHDTRFNVFAVKRNEEYYG